MELLVARGIEEFESFTDETQYDRFVVSAFTNTIEHCARLAH